MIKNINSYYLLIENNESRTGYDKEYLRKEKINRKLKRRKEIIQ